MSILEVVALWSSQRHDAKIGNKIHIAFPWLRMRRRDGFRSKEHIQEHKCIKKTLRRCGHGHQREMCTLCWICCCGTWSNWLAMFVAAPSWSEEWLLLFLLLLSESSVLSAVKLEPSYRAKAKGRAVANQCSCSRCTDISIPVGFS